MATSSALTRRQLAGMIDHTVLKPEASKRQIVEAATDARDWGCASVCVNGANVEIAREPGGASVCSVVGFPLGASGASVKAFEADRAITAGASEIDMVINIGALLDGDFARVRDDIGQVRSATTGAVLKVILETGLLSTSQLVDACSIAVECGADFVKTSTGFHPSGGATLDAVRTMRGTVGPSIGVKASGGIRDLTTATAMIDAGASRLGLSATAAVLAGLHQTP